MPSTKHGWFSQEAASQHGGSIYKTPNGEQIHITVVTETKAHGTLWKDIKYVGEVTDWVANFVPMSYIHDEITFKVLKNRTPPNPCPLSYTGTGACTCGKCPVRGRKNNNPFRY